MAVVSVTETWFQREGSFDDEGVREYSRHFDVFTDDVNDTAVTVLLAPGIPRLYDPFIVPNDFDTMSCVQKPQARQDPENPYIWRVTVQYSTKVLDPARFPENPLLKPSVVVFDTEKFRKIFVQDVETTGDVANTAGDPFNPPPEIDDSRSTLTITRNEATFNPATPETYRDTINQFPFFGIIFPAGTVKCDSISARIQNQGGLQFWEVTYKFHLSVSGWKIKLLNQGFRQLVGGVPTQIRDHGQPISQPARLDANGAVITDPNAASVYVTFNAYKTVDFDALNLP